MPTRPLASGAGAAAATAAAAAAAAAAAGLFLLAAVSPALAEQDPTGLFIALPLDVEVVSPANGSAVNQTPYTAVVEAGGETAGAFNDDFANGTRDFVDLGPSGLRANATSANDTPRYTSPVFELASDAPGLEWVSPILFGTSNSSGNLTALLALDVRFGDRSASRNWSGWVPATVDGEYGDPQGPGNVSLRTLPAVQYRFTFLDPLNASNPTIVDVHVWFLAHIALVEGRLQGAAAWTVLGTAEGRYNLTLALPEGPSVIEARVTDALGTQRVVQSALTLDTVRPQLAAAPADGASIPPDEAAEVRFSEPINATSAVDHITVTADFPVDVVWSADRTTLIVSAQESGRRGPVTVRIDPLLADAAGNTIGTGASFTYTMGKPAEAPADITPLLVALFALVGVGALAVLYFSGKAKRDRQAYADAVRRELDAAGEAPAAPLDPEGSRVPAGPLGPDASTPPPKLR